MTSSLEQLTQVLSRLLDDPDYKFRKEQAAGGVIDCSDEVNPIKAIQHFRYAIACGVVPDAEVLLFTANAFARYLESSSFCSLDEAFNLKSQKGTGRPTQQNDKQETQLLFLADMRLWRLSHPNTIQEEAFRAVSTAWALLDRLVPFTEETGVRYFERYMQSLRSVGLEMDGQ